MFSCLCQSGKGSGVETTYVFAPGGSLGIAV